MQRKALFVYWWSGSVFETKRWKCLPWITIGYQHPSARTGEPSNSRSVHQQQTRLTSWTPPYSIGERAWRSHQNFRSVKRCSKQYICSKYRACIDEGQRVSLRRRSSRTSTISTPELANITRRNERPRDWRRCAATFMHLFKRRSSILQSREASRQLPASTRARATRKLKLESISSNEPWPFRSLIDIIFVVSHD